MYTTEDPPPVTEERSLTRAAQSGRRTDRRAAAQQLLTFLDPGARSATPRAAPRLTDGFGALRVLQLLTWDVKRKAQTCPSHPLKERGDAFHRRTPSTADNAGDAPLPSGTTGQHLPPQLGASLGTVPSGTPTEPPRAQEGKLRNNSQGSSARSGLRPLGSAPHPQQPGHSPGLRRRLLRRPRGGGSLPGVGPRQPSARQPRVTRCPPRPWSLSEGGGDGTPRAATSGGG